MSCLEPGDPSISTAAPDLGLLGLCLEYPKHADYESPACRLQFPLGKKLAGIFEPTVEATIITPTAHVGAIMQLAQGRRGEMTEHALLGPERTLLK